MSSNPHHVALVVDPLFGERLASLSQRVHVWAVASSENYEVARRLWEQRGVKEHRLESGVTTFNPTPGASPEEECVGILETIDEHHGEYSHDPPWSILEVYGVNLTPRIQNQLKEFGITRFEITEDGFVCFGE